MSDYREIIKDISGYISVILLSLLYIPQTFFVYYHKDASGLSTIFLFDGMLLTIDTMVYGTLLGEPPLVIANVIACLCMILLLIAKYLWKNKKNAINEVLEINHTTKEKIQVIDSDHSSVV